MNRKIISEINVTPFIDVMLVLLVVFMIASPMMTPGIQVDLPQTEAAPVNTQDKSVVLTISKGGDIYLQDKLINLHNMKKSILESLGNEKDGRIFIRADKAANYGKVIKIIGAVQNSGFKKVALITDNENS